MSNSIKLVRKTFQNFYKQHKAEDAKVGLKKNALFQDFHAEMKLSPDKRDVEKLKRIVEELKGLRNIKLFRKEFPTFASFKKYCKKEDIDVQALSEF